MRSEDNDCIRYLMKEMDPSEELLMERAMMEDEDLLIEVESMRQTLQKCDDLPEVDPPSEVTDAIMEKAAEQAEKNRKSQSIMPSLKYAVAATLALTFTAGGMWLYTGTENTQPGLNNSTSSASQAASDVAAMQFIDQGSAVSEEKNEIEPWIDRNNVLRFEDMFFGPDSNFQTILESTTEKLQLIDQPMRNNRSVNSIQLTGGSGN